MRTATTLVTTIMGLTLLAAPVAADDPNWPNVPISEHRVFQAVNADGSSAYSAGFPVRLRGVVLNNPEDWLDQTPDYTPAYVPWYLGGQWEVFVQAAESPDFGGTACWMGQNYGNLPWKGDPFFNYTNDEWLGEMQRVNYPDGPGNDPVRAGDLIEIRARAGLNYAGKMNVNEQHDNDRDPDTGLLGNAHDFEMVILERGYGLPLPAALNLSDLLEEVPDGYAFIWDPTRQTGGEHYQAARVMLKAVKLADPTGWGPDTDLRVIDATGRELKLHLGRDPVFADTPAPTGTISVVGVLNQESQSNIGGYYLLALHPAEIACGDANCDGVSGFGDINPFILALNDPAAYSDRFPGCTADVTGDFVVDFADINPMVGILTSGVCP